MIVVVIAAIVIVVAGVIVVIAVVGMTALVPIASAPLSAVAGGGDRQRRDNA
jgi:hypothetical protein